MTKLLPRIEGGGGGGCPLLAIGITKACYVDDVADDPEHVSSVAGVHTDAAQLY